MIVTAHIKFSIGTTFLDNFFTAEDERLPGESIEDGVLRVRKHLENAVAILKNEKGEANGSDLPPHLKTEIKYAPYSPQPTPEINLQHERLEIEIDNCMCVDELKQWKSKYDVLPGKILTYYNSRLKELTK